MPELVNYCTQCGRSIGAGERVHRQGEAATCAHCELKSRLGLNHIEFCTSCRRLIGRGETALLIDQRIVCETCAKPITIGVPRSVTDAMPTRPQQPIEALAVLSADTFDNQFSVEAPEHEGLAAERQRLAAERAELEAARAELRREQGELESSLFRLGAERSAPGRTPPPALPTTPAASGPELSQLQTLSAGLQQAEALLARQQSQLAQREANIVTEKHALATREAEMIRRWSTRRAAHVVAVASVAAVLLLSLSFTIARWTVKPVWRATATIELKAPARASAVTPGSAAYTTWLDAQRNRLLSDDVLAETINRLNDRGIAFEGGVAELRERLSSELHVAAADGAQPNRVSLELRQRQPDAASDNVLFDLEALSRAFVADQTTREQKSGETVATRFIAVAARDVAPVEDHRLAAAVWVFFLLIALALLAIAGVRLWLLRSRLLRAGLATARQGERGGIFAGSNGFIQSLSRLRRARIWLPR